METEWRDLTDDWEMFADGINTCDIKAEVGTSLVKLSESKPIAEDKGYHTLEPREWMKVTAPLIGWVRKYSADASVSISTYATE